MARGISKTKENERWLGAGHDDDWHWESEEFGLSEEPVGAMVNNIDTRKSTERKTGNDGDVDYEAAWLRA
jgi:hypothetical protein